ncbi:uncharacterized protein LOC117647895 [Thrips palmi]|uniref:Uncharacterized protein LOC117647895 n=1 Tax=Thrips palmi TaxID=161013 RepID=A0A6P8Z6D5_THRPL|nr:uncharacterized protein LOC117647895 [Thrips palmi]
MSGRPVPYAPHGPAAIKAVLAVRLTRCPEEWNVEAVETLCSTAKHSSFRATVEAGSAKSRVGSIQKAFRKQFKERFTAELQTGARCRRGDGYYSHALVWLRKPQSHSFPECCMRITSNLAHLTRAVSSLLEPPPGPPGPSLLGPSMILTHGQVSLCIPWIYY